MLFIFQQPFSSLYKKCNRADANLKSYRRVPAQLEAPANITLKKTSTTHQTNCSLVGFLEFYEQQIPYVFVVMRLGRRTRSAPITGCYAAVEFPTQQIPYVFVDEAWTTHTIRVDYLLLR